MDGHDSDGILIREWAATGFDLIGGKFDEIVEQVRGGLIGLLKKKLGQLHKVAVGVELSFLDEEFEEGLIGLPVMMKSGIDGFMKGVWGVLVHKRNGMGEKGRVCLEFVMGKIKDRMGQKLMGLLRVVKCG